MNFRGSSEPQVQALDDDAVIDAVEELASELDDFAFERERVLAKLDIRAAAQARRTAHELRFVVASIPLVSTESREDGFEKLGELLGRAHALLEGARLEGLQQKALEAPRPAPGAREADAEAPTLARRHAKSTPVPTSDIRANSRWDLELDYESLGPTMPGEVEPDLGAAGLDEDLPAAVHGRMPLLRPGHLPDHRPTERSIVAVGFDDAVDAKLREGRTPRDLPPVFAADDEGANDFDDETVAKKVAWQRSGNRVLGR